MANIMELSRLDVHVVRCLFVCCFFFFSFLFLAVNKLIKDKTQLFSI